MQHIFWHESDEVANAVCRFKNPAAQKAEASQCLIGCADDDRRRVVSVERARSCRFVLVFRQFALERSTFLRPFTVAGIKNLRHRAPADVAHQHRFLLWSRRARFGLHAPKCLDCSKILLKLLFRSTFAYAVGFGDTVAVEVLRRFGWRRSYSSIGRRMYFSRNISHA